MLQGILKWFNFIPGLLKLLGDAGINTGTFGAEAIKIVTETQTDITNYDNGQAVVIAHISASDIPGAKADGVIVAMEVGGPAYTSIFG